MSSKGGTLLFLEGLLGWTPPIWFAIKKLKCDCGSKWEWMKALVKAFFFFTVFLVDLADAVVDLMLGFNTLVNGEEAYKGYGILLGVMTIVARLVAGAYGIAANSYIEDDEFVRNGLFFVMEIAVFMIEDGAAILLLANNPAEDVLTTISTWLTVICGVSFILYVAYFIIFRTHWWLRNSLDEGFCYKSYLGVLAAGMFLLWPFFILVILFQEVLLKDNKDGGSSITDESERASLVVYGIGSVINGGASVFSSFYILKGAS
jgi:hypothetical protein